MFNRSLDYAVNSYSRELQGKASIRVSGYTTIGSIKRQLFNEMTQQSYGLRQTRYQLKQFEVYIVRNGQRTLLNDEQRLKDCTNSYEKSQLNVYLELCLKSMYTLYTPIMLP